MFGLLDRIRPARKAAADPDPGVLWYVDEPRVARVECGDVVAFRGWAVSRRGQPVTVFLRHADGRRDAYELNIHRPDVAGYMEGQGITADPRCGFGFWVDLRDVQAGTGKTVHLEFEDDSGMVRSSAYTLLRGAKPVQARANYKEVWNEAAHEESGAMIAVAGYTAEDERWSVSAQRFVERVLEPAVGINADDEILEIGCGVGRVGEVLAPRCRRWVGADVSENMLAHLRQRLTGFPNVETVSVNGYDLAPVPSGSLDLVYCHVVFMHLDEWERFNYVREAFRVLRPGGRLYVDNFNLMSDEGWEFFTKNMDDYHPLDRPPHISKSSTPQELRVYLERAGFTAIGQGEYKLWTYASGHKPA